MRFDSARWKASTKALMSVVLAGGALFEIPAVHDFLIVLAHDHPHVVGLIATATGIATLLHNPQVQDVLGIKRTVVVEEVALPGAVSKAAKAEESK